MAWNWQEYWLVSANTYQLFAECLDANMMASSGHLVGESVDFQA